MVGAARTPARRLQRAPMWRLRLLLRCQCTPVWCSACWDFKTCAHTLLYTAHVPVASEAIDSKSSSMSQLVNHVHEGHEHTVVLCRRHCVGLQIQMPQSGQSRHRRMHLCCGSPRRSASKRSCVAATPLEAPHEPACALLQGGRSGRAMQRQLPAVRQPRQQRRRPVLLQTAPERWGGMYSGLPGMCAAHEKLRRRAV